MVATITLVLMMPAVPVRSQAPGLPGGNLGFNAAVASLFRDIPAFSAEVETALTNNTDKSHLTLPMQMLKRGDRFRIEVDFLQMKSAGVSLKGLGNMENIGIAKMVSLVLPEEKGMIVLFPELKFSAPVALSETDLPVAGFQVKKRRAGKDTILGKSCVRQNVVLEEPDGTRTDATVWEDPGLKDFPVRMLFRPATGSMMMTFSQVKLTPPAEDLFKVPSDYRKFSGIANLMQEALTRAYHPKATH